MAWRLKTLEEFRLDGRTFIDELGRETVSAMYVDARHWDELLGRYLDELSTSLSEHLMNEINKDPNHIFKSFRVLTPKGKSWYVNSDCLVYCPRIHCVLVDDMGLSNSILLMDGELIDVEHVVREKNSTDNYIQDVNGRILKVKDDAKFIPKDEVKNYI